MTYSTPSRRDIQRADNVWKAMSDGRWYTLDAISAAANIAPHLVVGDATKRAYTRSAIHWARILHSQPEQAALVCDRSDNTYRITNDPKEIVQYSDGQVTGPVLSQLRTIKASMSATPSNTKQVKLVRSTVNYLIDNIENSLVP